MRQRLRGVWSTHRRWAIGLGITFVGAVAITVGWLLVKCSPYASSLLQNAGIAFFLLLPLMLLERAFSKRVQQAEERTGAEVAGVKEGLLALQTDVSQTRVELGALREETEARLRGRRDADEDAVSRARADVSFENVLALLKRATSLNAISRRGLRVRLPHSWERLRFRHALVQDPGDAGPTDVIWIELQSIDGEDLAASAIWTAGRPAADMLTELAERWQAQGTFPGDAILDAGVIFEQLLVSLDIAISRRTSERGLPALSPLIEVLSAEWALTDFGIEHLAWPEDYGIAAAEIVRDARAVREHVEDKTWLADREGWPAQLDAAARFFKRSDEQSQRFRFPGQ